MTKQQITEAIQACNKRGDKAFVPYIMAGDGGIETLKETILFLQKIGVTAIELGIPFSDPVADGAIIQEAGERALAKGVTLRLVVETVASFKDEVTVPIILMTYLNPIIQYGIEEFAEDCRNSGISGLIIPDLPYEEVDLVRTALTNADIALIPLVSLTSPPERIEKITAAGEGFIYAVTVNGITGVRDGFESELGEHLRKLKAVSSVPVLAGFGISTPAQVELIGSFADGVIVGSAIVTALHNSDYKTVEKLVNASKNKIPSI